MKKFFTAVIILTTSFSSCFARVFDVVVAKDSSGDFTSINAAINSLPETGPRKTIFIKNGVYNEKVFIGYEKNEINKVISIIGENADSVIISWDDYLGKKIDYPGKGTITADGTTCPTMTVTSPDFYMENVTVRNPSTAAQAVALYQTKDKQTLKNCRIIGNQDTHRTKKGRRYFYYNTLIEGGVDFIYAGGTCYFYKCRINSNRGGYVTAPEDITYVATMSTGKTLRYGFFFKDCDLTANEGVSAGSVYLGRPWGPECGSVYLNCRLGNHINKAGWSIMGNDTYKTACFAEYQSMNADGTQLVDVSSRINWSLQLNTTDVNNLMLMSKIWSAVSSTPYDAVSMVIAPSPITNLKTNTGGTLGWDAVDGAKGYIVYADNTIVGFTETNSYVDNNQYVKAPVYNVKTVGEWGNLSVNYGETDNVTKESIENVVNSKISAIDETKKDDIKVAVNNGVLHFCEPTDFTLYNLYGQIVIAGKKVISIDLSSLLSGVYLIDAKSEKSDTYKTKILF
jgi:pectinesterase